MTANNQYFERNMLINAQKTNTILESEDWGPQTELTKINRFLDSSAANVENQLAIHNTLTSLLGENGNMETELTLLNKKLAYQNSRPPGVGTDEVWFPTQLLMQMVKLLEEGNEIQEETGGGAEIGLLRDISNNTGDALPLLQDISKNTSNIHDLLIDNSKNLISIKNEIQTGNSSLSGIYDNLYNTLGGPPQPWLETVNGNIINNTVAINATNTNLVTLSTQIGTLATIQQKKTATWTGLPPSLFVSGNWSAYTYPPKKFTLFIEVNQVLLATDSVDFLISDDGVNWFLRERFVAADFNPPTPPTTPACIIGSAHSECLRIGKNYDWCGTHMRLYCKGAPTLVIQDCYAHGI